jgi:hypothetical protein
MIEPSKSRSRPRTRRSELERLIDRTILEPTHPQLGTCWRFTGTTTPYGRIAKAQDSYTHRLGWKLLRGPIPEGKELHHRCGVYACWNPDHLQLVTQISGSIRKRVRGSAGRAARKVSERGAPSRSQALARRRTDHLGRFRVSPITPIMLTGPPPLPPLPCSTPQLIAKQVSLSHAIWSTSHLNWTNPRVCVSANLGPRPRAGPGSPSYAPAARGRDTQPAGRTLARG